jgi:Reverse transcriptase (RNA-dependent DNA polymerase)
MVCLRRRSGWISLQVLFKQGPAGTACRLKKALYGLKQAPRAWHTKFSHELEGLGFVPSDADPSLWVLHLDGRSVYVLVYVDDLLLAGKLLSDLQNVKGLLMSAFHARDLGEARHFIGMEREFYGILSGKGGLSHSDWCRSSMLLRWLPGLICLMLSLLRFL